MERTISIERMEEIATMVLHKLMEIDPDMGQRFMVEEIDMNSEEVNYFGVARKRTVTNIDWEIEEDENSDYVPPTEVVIPWNLFDDDIADWLSDEYGYCVLDYQVEDNDE